MIEQDPRLTEGPTFFQSLYGLLKRIITASNTNEKNAAQNTADIALKADIDSPTLTGDPKAPTPANSDNDTSIATTAWVRNAMATIATALGFVFSSGSPGYIKFPSYLGGWIVQWGTASTTASGVSVSFPIAFPNNVRVVQTSAVALGAFMTTFQSLSNSSVFIQGWTDTGTQANTIAHWLAVGS